MGNEKTVRCIIIGASPLLNKQNFISCIKKNDFIICADGGLDFALKNGIKPSLIIGDFDSFSGELPKDIETITLPHIKDDTDLHYAAKEGLKRGYKEFFMAGVTGGKRPDHTFAAISTLNYLCLNNAQAVITDGISNYYAVKKSLTITAPLKESYISLFPLDKVAEGVSISGVFYPLNNAVLTNDYPLGTSNEFTEKECTVSVKKGNILVILTPKN